MFRDYKNYEVCEDGRIWSKVRKKWLKPKIEKNGYQRVGLYDNEGKQHFQFVHRVCWMAVNGVWEIPQGYELHHCDEDKMNNHISNILLCSHQENCNYGTHNERSASSRRNHQEMSKRVGAYKNGELIMIFPSTAEARRQGYDQGAVWRCCRGKVKTHKGFEWRYLDN